MLTRISVGKIVISLRPLAMRIIRNEKGLVLNCCWKNEILQHQQQKYLHHHQQQQAAEAISSGRHQQAEVRLSLIHI